MEEKRKHPRAEINEPAYVSSGGSVMSCTVRNISLEGAAIDVENPAFVPQRFRLVMAKDSSVRECSIAWIQKKPDWRQFCRSTAGPGFSDRRVARIGRSRLSPAPGRPISAGEAVSSSTVAAPAASELALVPQGRVLNTKPVQVITARSWL
jgi:hypothetical protein